MEIGNRERTVNAQLSDIFLSAIVEPEPMPVSMTRNAALYLAGSALSEHVSNADLEEELQALVLVALTMKQAMPRKWLQVWTAAAGGNGGSRAAFRLM